MVSATGKDLQWDREVDVIVVGYGAAGGISAITAHDAGAKVLLIEKMPHPGGISMLSGGGVAFAHNADGAFQYLKRTCNGTTPDDILRKMAEEMVGMIDWLTELAKISGNLSVPRHQRHRFDQAQRLSCLFGISLGQRAARRSASVQSGL